MKPPAILPEKKGAASESEDAASDLISAIKGGDAKAADLALKRHYELCKSEPDEDDYEEA